MQYQRRISPKETQGLESKLALSLQTRSEVRSPEGSAEEELWSRLDEDTIAVPEEVVVRMLRNANISTLDNLMMQGADVSGARHEKQQPMQSIQPLGRELPLQKKGLPRSGQRVQQLGSPGPAW